MGVTSAGFDFCASFSEIVTLGFSVCWVSGVCCCASRYGGRISLMWGMAADIEVSDFEGFLGGGGGCSSVSGR